MFCGKTSLGIDISQDRINLALLKQTKNGVSLLKTATGAVPDGAIKDGNIEDAPALAKAIKKLASQNRMHAQRSALSLVANPMLMQILDLPKKAAGNVRQFVRDEMKHCAILPSGQLALDFCGIQTLFKQTIRRTLVVAADSQQTTHIAHELNRAGLNVESIEPASLAYIRACYAKTIAQAIDQDLLFVIVHGGIITFYLFRKQVLDLVRIKRPEPGICQQCTMQSERCRTCLADEINTVLQFYEMEAFDKGDKCQVKLIAQMDGDDAGENIKSPWPNAETMNLEITTLEKAYLDTPVAQANSRDKPSAIAVGLALKLLEGSNMDLNINLLSSEVAQAKAARKELLLIANVGVVIVVLMIFVAGLLGSKTKKTSEIMQGEKCTHLARKTQVLLNEQGWLDRQIGDVSKTLDCVDNILKSDSHLNWSGILEDIRVAIPSGVRITKISGMGASKLRLECRALSPKEVRLFIEMLNKCEHMGTASLAQTKTDDKAGNLAKYDIDCSLIP